MAVPGLNVRFAPKAVVRPTSIKGDSSRGIARARACNRWGFSAAVALDVERPRQELLQENAGAPVWIGGPEAIFGTCCGAFRNISNLIHCSNSTICNRPKDSKSASPRISDSTRNFVVLCGAVDAYGRSAAGRVDPSVAATSAPDDDVIRFSVMACARMGSPSPISVTT